MKHTYVAWIAQLIFMPSGLHRTKIWDEIRTFYELIGILVWYNLRGEGRALQKQINTTEHREPSFHGNKLFAWSLGDPYSFEN